MPTNPMLIMRRPAAITIISVILILLFTAAYLDVTWSKIARQYYDSLREDDLNWIGASVEGIESLFSNEDMSMFSYGDATAKTEINSYLDPLFSDNPALAGIRIFNPQQKEIFTRVGSLSNPIKAITWLEYHDAALSWKRIINNRRVPEFTDNIYQLQELAREQGEITESLERLVNTRQHDDATITSIYELQHDALSQAYLLSQKHPMLDDAISSMKETSNNLELEDQEALTEAFHSSEDAEEDVSMALEDFRATSEEVIHLPDEAIKSAPASQTWGGHIWPFLRGRQICIPIYLPSAGESLIAPAGMVEATFYHYPGDVLAVFNWRWFLIIIPVIALIVLFKALKKSQVINENTESPDSGISLPEH